ncbi:SDR family oxidoreductase [Enterobacter sp. Ap-1006]|nr:SDR family oxidoreductase [Enterobacter sp. Ap-1006]
MANEIKAGLAVVTGASAGIGALYAEGLAARGYDLLLVARRANRLEQQAERIRKASGRKVEALALDLAQPGDLKVLEDRIGGDETVSVLVNNAGVGGLGLLAQSAAEDAGNLLALNIVALTRLTHAVLPGMLSRANGAIVNVASIQAWLPRPNNAAYGGSKVYVLQFTESLQQEVEGRGVFVQALMPGATATDFWSSTGIDIKTLPTHVVMSGEDFVGAALIGFDKQEPICIPGLPDLTSWEAFTTARRNLGQACLTNSPALRYSA